MSLTSLAGIIERRILANYRIDPTVVADFLPAPFRPKLVNGQAIGGICLIRLGSARPAWLPRPFGLRSENAAHRFAVEWDDCGTRKEGVYIPRRDTSSLINATLGGLLFPVIQHRAQFTVQESDQHVSVSVHSADGKVAIDVSGTAGGQFPKSSVFPSLEAASEFFRKGSVGYSNSNQTGEYHGIELDCERWDVHTLQIESMRSSFFEDSVAFPSGSVEFDCALLMRGIAHHWHRRQTLCCQSVTDR